MGSYGYSRFACITLWLYILAAQSLSFYSKGMTLRDLIVKYPFGTFIQEFKIWDRITLDAI
ncbi:uncharacterized protein BDW43DRAFT_41780 [Aspergillus alliaceus]|uniref:uncharacterized protein n=1 Tax=Petromyces alliaceus TaxID=209559 RepID=UPI0012A73697|nr:uncharacterized protein BDW43DRAFT_41780 [Aspergillus alliaceus]KAB8235173.1 hypothetical protein BDW43DRAFT_41780 [Aspergillus alliaceus]